MKLKLLAIAASILFLVSACSSITGNQEQLKKEVTAVLKENPEIIMDVLKENGAEFLSILQIAAAQRRGELLKERGAGGSGGLLKPVIEETRPVRGDPNAPVTMVEYSDFQCPFCARALGTVLSLLEKYEGKVRLIYKHFPITSIHDKAKITAVYFEAIVLQDPEKAWLFHDKAFANQSDLAKGEPTLIRIATEVGADLERLAEDVKKEAVIKQVDKDLAEAQKFGFTGTPTFLINGRMIVGAQPESEFVKLIEEALKDKETAKK